jgi:polyhydroxybutyrate depolymerase
MGMGALAILAVVVPSVTAYASPQLAASLVPVAGPGGDEPQARSLEFGGQTRSYTVFLPPNYATGDKVPLVVELHAFQSDWETQRKESEYFKLHADPQDGFVIAYPQGTAKSWNAGACCGQASDDKVDDVAFIVEMVHRILVEWPRIDAGRVYVTGLSNGSGMTQRLGVEASDTFVAGAGYGMRLLVPAPEKRRPFAYLDVATYGNRYVPYGGDKIFPSAAANAATWATLQGCKPTPRIERLSPPGTADEPNQCAYYEGCTGDVAVVACSVRGGHYVYNTQDKIDVSRLGWEFMKRFHR